MEILVPVLALGLLGAIFGVGLAIASKRLAVAVDPRLERIHSLLPGSNCGACGGAGCFGFAEALLSGKLPVAACRVSAQAVKEKIAGILGQALEENIDKIATLHCYGGRRVQDRFVYAGIKDCVAANLVLGGQKACIFSCLGFGTCAKVCPFDAITMSEDDLPVIDAHKCKFCNKCVAVCPKRILSLVALTHNVYVACSSHDCGRDTKAVCSVGCIACRLCEKTCRFDAIHVLDNLALIDYNKCTSCGECVEVCPAKTIKVR